MFAGYNDGIESQYAGGDNSSGLDPSQGMMNPPYNSMFSAYRPDRPERYSRKVFVGGLPPDIDEGLFAWTY